MIYAYLNHTRYRSSESTRSEDECTGGSTEDTWVDGGDFVQRNGIRRCYSGIPVPWLQRERPCTWQSRESQQ